eukprot:932-Heterococcus_DN1.PRE.8
MAVRATGKVCSSVCVVQSSSSGDDHQNAICESETQKQPATAYPTNYTAGSESSEHRHVC